MQNSRAADTSMCCTYNLLGPGVCIFLTVFFSTIGHTQTCPPNLDFETGTFDNWTCYTGTVGVNGFDNVINLQPTNGPIAGQHTMYAAGSSELDPYGGFPVICPNGSGYSIKLGNDQGGARAEGISYEFTIPANRDYYSLIYHYAVVFQDPNHEIYQQPRLEIEITNLSDNQIIHCSSFTFIPVGTILPGFFVSPVQVDTTNVWYKNWSAVSINLNGNAGKTIRLFFKTADCTFIRHFGYAYIDVNTECSSEFVGATFCPDDTTVHVTAPWGYQNYTWFDNNFTSVIGNQQIISFTPPPPVGTTIAVEVVPYDGYGCLDTLYALLMDTLTVRANAGKDTLSCNRNQVPIGANPIPGYAYSWRPPDGLSNPFSANPRAGPSTTTTYVLTARSQGGGCATTDTVVVKASIIDTTIRLTGSDTFCVTSQESAVLSVAPTDRIQWYWGSSLIPGATQPDYRVTQSGTYQALLSNNEGCKASTEIKNILIEVPMPGIRYPLQYALADYPFQLRARKVGVVAEWDPVIFLNNPVIYEPVFNGNRDMLYTIALKTAGGCITVDTQEIKIVKEVRILVPSAFTPNNDGLNDYLKPTPMGIKELKYFRIYNRWGQLVFDLQTNSRGWDGNIGGRQQDTQVFVWVAEGIGVDDRRYRQKGTTALIR